ncbi:methyltransferase domain-containing protein [Aliidiomarina soli]|uniref:methyltransferase domain-containing protein n=1 Tax=Aliidiomarina soli TaxID=1928574 RepID=UPI001F5405CF|nr:methyltransferase domain-containing protein [Aliidiomarina soli]
MTLTAPRKGQDRSFAVDVQRFEKNIYHTSKGRIRQAVLAADLAALIASERPLRVLDIGAGLGQVNQLFAEAGHLVWHSDIAAEMVAQAKEQHSQAGLSAQYQYITAPLQDLPAQLVDQPPFDVVLCHAVLEWLEQPAAAISILSQLMVEGGWLSLMFYNRRAKEMANLIYGNFDYVKAGLQVKKKVRFSPQTPLYIEQVSDWTLRHRLQLVAHSGVRCIHDYLRDLEHQQRDDLIEMELRYRRQEPFRQLGRYQHFLLRKEIEGVSG